MAEFKLVWQVLEYFPKHVFVCILLSKFNHLTVNITISLKGLLYLTFRSLVIVELQVTLLTFLMVQILWWKHQICFHCSMYTYTHMQIHTQSSAVIQSSPHGASCMRACVYEVWHCVSLVHTAFCICHNPLSATLRQADNSREDRQPNPLHCELGRSACKQQVTHTHTHTATNSTVQVQRCNEYTHPHN